MEIWKKNYSNFTTLQLHPFWKLFQTLQTFFLNKIIFNKICQTRRRLQHVLELLGQFLLTKINLSKKIDYKQHLFILIKIPTNENIIFISSWNPTTLKICLAQKPIVGNTFSCFSHHYSRHLMSLISTW
jgi:hypothetical protein